MSSYLSSLIFLASTFTILQLSYGMPINATHTTTVEGGSKFAERNQDSPSRITKQDFSSNDFGGEDELIYLSRTSSDQQVENQDIDDLETAASDPQSTKTKDFGQGGMRRGYGGTLRRPWGYSSHEWGLGRG